VRYGIYAPNFGDYGDPRTLAALARETEEAGWDGFFVWDHLQFFDPDQRVPPVADPWVALSAIAVATDRIRLGPMVTPVTRRRPWKLARETASLDRLSGGRLILGVGLGGSTDADFARFGEETDAGVRARKLDEGLAVLAGLWSGEPFGFQGEHYRVRETTFLPTPVQSPRVPIWVAGQWPNRAPMRRAVRWDGVFPAKQTFEVMEPDELREVVAHLRPHRDSDTPFDVVLAGETPGDHSDKGASVVAPYAEAGLTWWLEALHDHRGPLEAMRERIRRGPPEL
jgi:alkanesulfonate monooxygenase SsuD/methylene tetrahydromethanopterin reductase-like flavin-dependent oxidoreductase (luciferase family)